MYLVNFFPEAQQYKTTSSVNPFPETKDYQSPLNLFQKKIATNYISRKSVFKNKKKYRLHLALILIQKRNNAEFQTAQGRFHYHCLHERIGQMFFNKHTLMLYP
jgi:hypothetical protein